MQCGKKIHMKVTFGRHTYRKQIRLCWESGSLLSGVHTYALDIRHTEGFCEGLKFCLVMDFMTKQMWQLMGLKIFFCGGVYIVFAWRVCVCILNGIFYIVIHCMHTYHYFLIIMHNVFDNVIKE